MAEESGVPLGLNAGPPAAAAAARVVHEAEQQISAAEAQVRMLFGGWNGLDGKKIKFVPDVVHMWSSMTSQLLRPLHRLDCRT